MMQLYGMMNGLEKASATGLDTVARVGQMNMHQQQMKIAQDAAERQRVLFEQQQAKEQEHDRFNNSYLPLTVFHPNIDKQPNRLSHYAESIKALGGDVKVSESGVTLVRPKDVELYYKTGQTQQQLIKQEMEMAFKDLDAKNAEITKEIMSLMGKDDDKSKARIQKLKALQLEVQTQMGNTYKATTEYQKQIAEEQAKVKEPKAPTQVIVGDEIKYRDNNTGGFVEGLGGPRYKPTSGDSGKEAKRDAKEVRKEQIKIYDDAIKDYDHNIQFAKGQLKAAQDYDEENPGSTKYKEMTDSLNENQKQRDITAQRRRDYLSGTQSKQATGTYKTAEDVKAAFKAGTIKEAEAVKILKDKFGMK